jgi:hypothetical protein
VRDVKTDQYGIRAVVALDDQPIRFEIVREARIALDGVVDERLGIPMLTTADMFAEKLLANADRCQDRAVAYRNAIDLGMLLMGYGPFPQSAVRKATEAYGSDIERKIGWVLTKLDEAELAQAADALQMDDALAVRAIDALRNDAKRMWPAL